MTEAAPLNGALLQSRAETLAQNLPPLLARAVRLADGVFLGEHGRRQPGTGDAFWQYRPAVAGDSAHAIDWRRSARSDQHFVQQKEWQAAQIVLLWADNAASMAYRSDRALPTKADRAALIALAVSTLLIRGGEQVGLDTLPAGRGRLHLGRLAMHLSQNPSLDTNIPEYGTPEIETFTPHSRALFLSDFFGDLDQLRVTLTRAAGKGVKGALVQILDPAEHAFPFQGRTLFESMGKGLSYETRKARDLHKRYSDRLATRKQALAEMAAHIGWQIYFHQTNAPVSDALLWVYNVLGEKR